MGMIGCDDFSDQPPWRTDTVFQNMSIRSCYNLGLYSYTPKDTEWIYQFAIYDRSSGTNCEVGVAIYDITSGLTTAPLVVEDTIQCGASDAWRTKEIEPVEIDADHEYMIMFKCNGPDGWDMYSTDDGEFTSPSRVDLDGTDDFPDPMDGLLDHNEASIGYALTRTYQYNEPHGTIITTDINRRAE